MTVRAAPLAAALAAVLAAAPAGRPARAEPYDVPWFAANPAERLRWLRACHADARVDPAVCRNAEAAEAGEYGRRLRGGAPGGAVPDDFLTPRMRDFLRQACQDPVLARPGGLFAPSCRRT